MTLVKQSDINDLQNKKAALDALLEDTLRAYDKSKNDYTSDKAALDASIATGKTSAGPNSSSVDEIVEILNGKNSLVSQRISEIYVGDMKYAVGGDNIFEITDPNYAAIHEDNWDAARAEFDSGLRSKTEDIDADAERKFSTLRDAILDISQRDMFEVVYKDIKKSYEAFAKSLFEIAISDHVNTFTITIANKWIVDNIDNNELLKRFNEEKEERKEAVRESFARQNRKNSILRDNFEEISQEMTDLDNDSEIVIDELKTEMGISGEGDDDIVKETIKANKENQKIFDAMSALVLTRESLFDLSIGGIIEKIKEACYKGETKIQLTGDEISGTEIYALTQSGYKVTHQKISSPGRNKDNTLFTIDWVSAGSK